MSRRRFAKLSVMGGVGAYLARGRTAAAFNSSPGVPLFGTKLRGAGPGGIPVAVPGIFRAPVTGVTHYELTIEQYDDSDVCPTLGSTKLWGYVPKRGLGGWVGPRALGGIIVAQRNQPIQLSVENRLGVRNHILPVDRSIPGANQAINRTAVHLHGGKVPWISDGGPFDWYDPKGAHGTSFLNNKVLNPNAIPGSGEYYYPMSQSARFMWYHDHAFGLTRLNAYAGIASGLILRDTYELALVNKGMPNYLEAGGNELPLIFQDKVFVGPNIGATDPTWPGPKGPGNLWYPHVYDPNRWELSPNAAPPPDPSCVPEFFGDTMLVNGTVFPQATVQARRYRLRLLNACNARFLNLQLYVDDGSPNGITLDASGRPKNSPFVNAATGEPAFLQIGAEGGFLPKPVKVPSNVPMQFRTPPDPVTGQADPSAANLAKSLLVAPAERPDILVDFSNYAGQRLVLYNDCPAPFPSGGDEYDFFPGLNVATNPVNGTTRPGFGPNTRVLMRFKVVPATGAPDAKLLIDTTTDLTAGLDPFLVSPDVLRAGVPAPPGPATRFLTLNETFDDHGRLSQTLGNLAFPGGSPFDGSGTGEDVLNGATEVWEIFNTTADTHPMHIHLVNFQLVNRQLFDPASMVPNGPLIPPDPNETGWKETVAMYPGTVTRLIMKFEVPAIRTAQGRDIPTPPSPRTGDNEYVWHCHILEHEEHDMMHALVVR